MVKMVVIRINAKECGSSFPEVIKATINLLKQLATLSQILVPHTFSSSVFGISYGGSLNFP